MKEIAKIPGAYGKQMRIEEALKSNDLIAALLSAEKLPNCPQKLQYMRLIYEAEMKGGTYCSAIDLVKHFPEKEKLRLLEEIVAKSKAENRKDWAQKAYAKFPDGNRKTLLVEEAIAEALSSSNIFSADELAKMISRKLSTIELEKYIADNLMVHFHGAQRAAELLKREITIEELRKAMSHAVTNNEFHTVLFLAKLFPEGDERNQYFRLAGKHFAEIGASSELAEICKLEKRPMSNDEMKAIYQKGDSIFGHITEHYIELLMKDSMNISYLENDAISLATQGKVGKALLVAKLLPSSQVRTRVLEIVAEDALVRDIDSHMMQCATLLSEGDVKTRLAKCLIRKALRKHEKLDDEKDVKEVLEAVKLLPRNDEKLAHLKKLFKASQKLEEERSREEFGVTVIYDVEKELDKF